MPAKRSRRSRQPSSPRTLRIPSRSRNPKAFEDLGHAQILTGDNDGAIASYNRAIELNGTNANAYLNRGAAWYQKNDFVRAAADFRVALNVAPANWIRRDDAQANLKLAEQQLKSAPAKGAGGR